MCQSVPKHTIGRLKTKKHLGGAVQPSPPLGKGSDTLPQIPPPSAPRSFVKPGPPSFGMLLLPMGPAVILVFIIIHYLR